MAGRDAPRLGRGLAALFGEAAEAEQTLPQTVRVDRIEPSPFQPRQEIDPVALDELVESIRAQGILQPVLVREHPARVGFYQLIAGERRWRAAGLAGLAEMPVLVRNLADRDAMAAGLVENLQRRDLNAVEEAQGFQRLLEEFSLTQDDLGRAVGKSRSHVANSLRLLTLPASVQEYVRTGVLSAGHARAALAHRDPEAAAKVIVARQLSVRDAERLASATPARTARTPRTPPHPDITELASRLSERLGLLVSISHGSTGGSVTVRYRTLDQLDSLLQLLG